MNKLKRIEKGWHGDGNKYLFGKTIFRIGRLGRFAVYDEAKGINYGDEIFRIYGRVDFNYGMRKFKEWLIASDYNSSNPSSINKQA